MEEMKNILLKEADKLYQRFELSKRITPDYFEPGMMEYLDKSYGFFDKISGELTLRFEAKGTRYDGRTEAIEKVQVGDKIKVERDKANPYNYNNFMLLTAKNKNVGNMPASLCNAIAPLFDREHLAITEAKVSFVEPISKRSRYAKQAILFVELKCKFLC